MDNLWGYGEDEPSSSSCLGPSSQEWPSSSAGSASPLTTQAAVMAGRPSSVVPVMSGPVPPVSARSGSSLPGSQDSVPPSRGNHDDLPPPPPLAEPYEVFLARVRRDLSNSSGSATQPDAAAPPRHRRRQLEIVSVRPSPRMRTPPGRFNPRYKPPGSGCHCQRPSMRLLLLPGCGPDGVPP